MGTTICNTDNIVDTPMGTGCFATTSLGAWQPDILLNTQEVAHMTCPLHETEPAQIRQLCTLEVIVTCTFNMLGIV